MKKIYLYAATALLMASCAETEMVENPVTGQTIEFMASMEGNSDSRTAFGEEEDGYRPILWEKNDALKIFMGAEDVYAEFTLTKGEGTGNAVFQGNSAFWGSTEGDETDNTFANIAYYPYSKDNISVSYNSETEVYKLSAILPTEQKYAEGATFAQNTSPMVAVTESKGSNQLKFKNAAAWFQLPVKGTAKISKLVMKSTKKIAGEYSLEIKYGGDPTITMGENAVNEITLVCDEPVQLSEEPTIFTFTTVPNSFDANGLSIDIYDVDGNIMRNAYSLPQATEISRSQYAPLSEVVFTANVQAMTLGDFVTAVTEGNGTYDGQGATVKIVPASSDTESRTVALVPDRLQIYSNPEVYYAQYQRFEELTDINICNVNFVFVPAAVTVKDGWNPNGYTTTEENINGELQFLNSGSVTLTGCTFNQMAVSPINAKAVSVNNCTFSELDAYAVKDIKAESVTVDGTTFNDCNGAFWLSNAPKTLKVTDNQFLSVGRRGAMQFSSNGDYTNTEMTVTGNVVTGGAFLWQLNTTVTYDQLLSILDTTKNTYEKDYVEGSVVIEKPKAKIGNKGYASLQDALKASTDEDVIVISADCEHEFSGSTVAAANVTIVGENKETSVVKMSQSIYLQDKSVTLKDLTFTVPTGLTYTEQAFAFVHHAKNFNFENCIIDRLRLNVNASEITGCEFNITTTDGFDGYGLYYYGNDGSKVKVSKSKFNTAGKAIVMYSEAAKVYDLTVEECEFISSNSSTDKAAIQMHAEYGISGKLTINKSTATGFANVNGGLWYELNNNTKVVTNNFTKVVDGVYYIGSDKALEEAVKMNGDINIVLTGDVNLNASDAYLKLGGEGTNKISIKGQTKETKLNLETTYWSRLNTVNPNAVIAMENLTLTSSQASGTWNSYDVTFQCNVDLKDVNLEKALALDGEGKTANLTNVNISETHDYYALWISAAGQTVNIDGGKIASDGRGIKIDEQYVGTPALVNLTVKNYEFSTKNKAAIMVKSTAGAKINLENINITNVAADTEYAVWCDEDAAANIGLIEVTGGKLRLEGYFPVADGVMTNADNSEYLISSKPGMLWLANEVLNGNSFKNSTVKLTDNIDLGKTEWSPIGGQNGGDSSYNNNFAGTFDGNGKTISGLKVTNQKCAGLFSTMCGGTIKNLTIDGAELNTHHYAGAIVAWMEQGGSEFTMENCHVKNAIITVTPDKQDSGKYDNGDKAGALVGFMHYGTINNCTATGIEITAYRDLGGIVGYANGTTVTNNKVENATLTVDQKTNYYEDKVFNAGPIIGRRGEKAPNESNNTYDKVNILSITAEDGDFYKVLNGGGF